MSITCSVGFVAALLLTIQASPADFFVAPDGDDGNAGTAEAPFATVGRGQEAVREMVKAGLTKDVTVVLRGGVYALEEPLRFGPEDGGSNQYSVTYAAWPGEEVVISGGRKISGWEKGRGGKWTAVIPQAQGGAWPFRDLYADGKRLRRARYPAGDGLLRVERVNPQLTEITLTDALPVSGLAGQNAELVMYQNWSISRVAITKIEGRTITVNNPMGWIGHGDYTGASANKPCYLEHALGLVAEPGEWYLDYESGTLTYQAAEGEDPNTRCFIAPRVTTLLAITGTSDRPLHNLHFRGLRFEHAAWHLPSFGYLGIQAGHHGTSMDQPTYVLPHAVEFTHAINCSLQDCTVAHTGAGGIGLGAGCQGNRVAGCELFDVGGNGILIGRRSVPLGDGMILGRALDSDWPDPADVPRGNIVTDNLLHACGAINHGCVGIYDAFCDGTQIIHNHVHHVPYTGISVGFRWNESETSQRHTLIAFNKVHDTMMMLADGGCLYTLGYQPGTVIRGNLFYNVHRSEFAHGGAPNNGIFFDQGSKGYRVDGNIIHSTSGEPIRFNQTHEGNMTWNDNAFGVPPTEPEFPHAAAARTGPRN